ncbi:DUF4242 domain-containing protein [Amphiplicatus metriothermophilus]|uniref:DUF4242 domain-containing protein n=1 Tax=Amphiplicatus metriothermophilus TaxID=1519374 RepID=A0A239PTQ3_9PROT|nr:DUF4242 domain-containing protein [Amphiplicatus metriothermophilus]MBB5519331.1 hypothetical protein [Amphiplicatus metriothermophilus]SNT73413.1 Protein of unknown function [Amphiplicatus metriothermophilus]
MLRKYVIERDIPGVGDLGPTQLGEAASKSNAALGKLRGIQWQHSYVTRDKTFCIYLAESEEAIREHSLLSGFPVARITEVSGVIDPSTERKCELVSA